MSKSQPAHASGTAKSVGRRRGNALYLTIWSVLGLGAAAYLVLIAIGRPLPVEAITSWNTGDGTTLELRKGAGLASGANTDADWTRMNRDIAHLKDRVTTVTEDVARLNAGQEKNTERVARLEAWQSVVVRGSGTVVDTYQTGAAAPESPASQAVARPESDLASNSAIEGTTLDGVTRTRPPETAATTPSASSANSQDAAILAALLDNDPAAAAAALGGQSAPPATASPVQPDVAPEPAEASVPIAAVVPLPGRRIYGVELGSGESVDSLRLTWALLNERHRDLVGSLAPRYVQSGSGENSIFRLIAGPFSSSTRARELCTQLQAYYVNCQTSAFTGSVL